MTSALVAGGSVRRQAPLRAVVRVDLHEIVRDARACIDEQEVCDLDGRLHWDLLPDWYDDWLFLERERLGRLRVHALEALCRRFLDAGFPARAIDLALTAVSVEPLRESAHRALISTHLAEGNVSRRCASSKRSVDSCAMSSGSSRRRRCRRSSGRSVAMARRFRIPSTPLHRPVSRNIRAGTGDERPKPSECR